MVHFYGYYSHVFRGKRKKQNGDAYIPYILEPEGSNVPLSDELINLVVKRLKLNRPWQ